MVQLTDFIFSPLILKCIVSMLPKFRRAENKFSLRFACVCRYYCFFIWPSREYSKLPCFFNWLVWARKGQRNLSFRIYESIFHPQSNHEVFVPFEQHIKKLRVLKVVQIIPKRNTSVSDVKLRWLVWALSHVRGRTLEIPGCNVLVPLKSPGYAV